MTDTTPEAVERLIDRIHESKAGRDVRTDAIATLRALSAEVARLKAPGEPVTQTPPEDVGALREALTEMVGAVCGDTGFAACVRRDSGRAYPWEALEIAEAKARAALAKQGGAE